jgi:PAS domain S-box-containing protein
MVKEILEVDGSYNPTLTGGLEFYVGENKENVQQAVANLISEGLEFDEELLLLTAKGHERWIRIIGKSELANNKRTKIYVSFQDIDVRKKAEEELSTTSERLLLATTSAKMGIWDWDIVNDSLIWDNKMYELYGIEKTDFTGALSAWQKGVHPDDIEQAGKELTDAISGIRDFKTEFRVMWPDKSIHFIEGYGIVSRNGEEEAVRMIGVNIDITKRKKTEENLFQSNERFEKVTEATNDAIWDWDMVNKTFYRSKAFERFFGKDATGIFPDSDLWSRDRFHPEDFTKIQKSINEAITNPLTTRGELEYRLLNKNEEIHYVINRAVIIRDSEGNAIRMVGAMTDISEQKQMTLQLSELNQSFQQHTLELERSNEELEQFAFVAYHDLQEPLRMISSFMELLKRKYGDNIDEKGHQYIHFATDGAKRMKQIILDLLDYSRAGKISEEKEVVSLDEVVSEFKQLRRKLISEKNATITASELPTLNIKRAVITQILHCLLDNALKYSLEDIAPIIEIDVAENESEWVFAVKDNGIGIDSQFHEKIFVIFQRLHNKEKYEGTGIGLSITKRHVEFLGGRIWLESKVEVGTKFYFTIPKN